MTRQALARRSPGTQQIKSPRPARTHAPATRQRPFLKWAGNKYRVLDQILQRLPPGRRLIEPFAGSGALFLNTDYERYLLTDSNADLITLYEQLKTERTELIDYCRQFFTPHHNQSRVYYALREEFNALDTGLRRAALFVYLNRHGYNGLCRYNADGGFNVPFGRYRRPYFPEAEMQAFAHKARLAQFRQRDFAQVMARARPGDVIYCDPPYVPLSDSANFTSYSAGGFNLDQQQRLADAAQKAALRGVPVLISNHATRFTREAYRHAARNEFTVQRYISCNGTQRHHANELLALFKAKKQTRGSR